jgi:hypothetical protein
VASSISLEIGLPAAPWPAPASTLSSTGAAPAWRYCSSATKTQLGLADFRVRSYEAVELYVVAVHRAWAYVEERLARERSAQIRRHDADSRPDDVLARRGGINRMAASVRAPDGRTTCGLHGLPTGADDVNRPHGH